MSDSGYGSQYEPSYPSQQPDSRDDYGNPTYTQYSPSHAYDQPTGRDSFGNPTYN
jgi:hypothetical protein